jgi:hypothetical protein
MTTGPGIHVKQSERRIPHDLQNMRVTADEEARPQPLDFLSRPRVVTAWMAPDVSHIYAHALALPLEILREFGAELRAVDVPVNSAQWFEVSESIEYFR